MTARPNERTLIEALVPVSRREFFESYASDPAATGFTAFLFGRPVEVPANSDLSNTHTASLATFAAFQSGDESSFREVYSELSRRQLRSDAPWWLNDPLMFGLVLCALRFGGDTSWLRATLKFRNEKSTGEPNDVTLTFTDILSENWGSETNLRPLVLVARYLLHLKNIESSLLNSVYHMLTETPFPYYESNFLNSVCLRAFDIVILSKAPEQSGRAQALKKLVDMAWKRSRTSGWIVWLIILLCFVGLIVEVFLWVKGLGEGNAKQWLDTLSLIGVPFVGILPIGWWISKHKYIVSKIQRWVAVHDFGLDINVLCPTDKKPIVPLSAQSKHPFLPDAENDITKE